QIVLAQSGNGIPETENGSTNAVTVIRKIVEGPQAGHQEVMIYHRRMIESETGRNYLLPTDLLAQTELAPDEERIYDTPPDPSNPDASFLKETRQWFFR